MTEHARFLGDGVDWWAEPPEWLPRLDDAVDAAGIEGLVLEGPARVPLTSCDTFPVFVCQRARYADLPDASFGRNGCVVAVDLLGHHVYAGPIAIADNVVAPELPEALLQPPSGSSRPLLGTSTQSVRVELRAQLDLPWAPTRYLVTALVCDRASNRIESVLDVGSYRDPAVDEFLAAQRAALQTGTPWPEPARDGAAYPSYSRIAGLTPQTPEGLGIALAARGSVVAGAFRLPLVEREIVKARSSLVDGDLFPSVRLVSRPTAVVEIALVITSAAGPVPTLLRLSVPAFGLLDTTDDDTTDDDTASVASGCFALDLAAMDEVDTKLGRLYVLAFADRSMAGPVTVRSS